MPRDENPFLAYLDTHPEADASALKQLFRLLAKRTHPDLGAANESAFVRLQSAYSEALAELSVAPAPENADAAATGPYWVPTTPRERVLHHLDRYVALLPSLLLESSTVPPRCREAFSTARAAARHYDPECRHALAQFEEQFHDRRRALVRYPEVTTKYRDLMQGLESFFTYFTVPNPFNLRLANSYLAEIGPVTDFDPTGPPELRTNRSAAARSALYLMKSWLAAEINRGPTRFV